VFYDSIALISGDKYLLASEGFTPQIDLYDVSNGGFAIVATAVPTFFFGRVIWSPLAGEWVHFGQDAAQLQCWFTSYNKLTLAQVGQANVTNAVGNNTFQPWGMICSPTTGKVYAVAGNHSDIRTYDSITHIGGADLGLASLCFGSLGLNDTANRLYVAQGGNTDLFPGQVAQVTVYNATTLALVDTISLPGDGVGHGFVAGCVFNPDNGMLYVAGNDEGGDGGDVVWVINPTTHALVATIRLLTNICNLTAATVVALDPVQMAYDTGTHQIYIYASNQKNDFTANGGVHVICCDTNTRRGFLNLNPDATFGTFLGDVALGLVLNTAPPGLTNTIFTAESFNPSIRGFTFP
jgi:DNA-binding beta-propeller fold protein YncE